MDDHDECFPSPIDHFSKYNLFVHLLNRSLADVDQRVKNEVSILQSLKNLHTIVTLNDVLETDLHYYLVMDYMNGGDLFDRIVKKGMYPQEEARVITKNLLSTVNFIHYNRIAHRDLKPQNLCKSRNEI